MVDAIEIYNPTAFEADIRGWFLTDDRSEPTKARIPNDAQYVLNAGGYAVVYASVFSENPGSVGGLDLPGFALSARGDSVSIYAAGFAGSICGYAHGYGFGAAENGVAFGRYTSSDGLEHFVAQSVMTLGSVNAPPQAGPVVISEIYYNPVGDDVEYVVLTNISNDPVCLWDTSADGNPANTWEVEGIGFAFDANTTLPVGGKALIVNANPLPFRNRYGVDGGVLVFGPFGNDSVDGTAALANGGEAVTLLWPDTPDIDLVPYVAMETVTYDDVAPWPGADGNGMALKRIDLAQFGDDPANWVAAEPSYPDPGAAGVETDVNGDAATDAVDVQLVINAALGIAAAHDCDVNGDSTVNALDVQLVINGALGI